MSAQIPNPIDSSSTKPSKRERENQKRLERRARQRVPVAEALLKEHANWLVMDRARAEAIKALTRLAETLQHVPDATDGILDMLLEHISVLEADHATGEDLASRLLTATRDVAELTPYLPPAVSTAA